MTQSNSHSIRRATITGHYANFFQIGQNADEFVVEFGQQTEDEVVIFGRLFLTPARARMLANLLNDAIQRHEDLFGRPLNIVPGK